MGINGASLYDHTPDDDLWHRRQHQRSATQAEHANDCARRGNGTANTRGREAAKQRSPKANSARIQQARNRGYVREYAGGV